MRILVVLLSVVLVGYCPSLAAKDRLIFDADTMNMLRSDKSRVVELQGNVNIVFQDQHLLADRAVIDEETQIIRAYGHVILQTPKTTMRGEEIEFDYAVNKGKVHKGVITSGQVLIESDLIEKVGEEEYWARDAYYTACMSCPPSWGFTSKKIRAEIGGYAYIYQPWLYLLQFPILPLPYLAVPLNSKRQTGFLVPRPGLNTQGGYGITQPFFWAIDRSQDMTFEASYYEKRDLQLTTQYRYVLSPTSSGELNFGFIKDRGASRELKDLTGEASPQRWFVDYAHFYDLPQSYVHRAQIQLASDTEYAKDFPNQFNYFGEPAFDNRTSITKNWADTHLSVDASYYISQTEERVSSDNRGALHRVPQINFLISPQQLIRDYPLTFEFHSQYLNVGRQGASYDKLQRVVDTSDPQGTNVEIINTPGDFTYRDETNNTGDLVRSGQRLDNIGRVAYPFWLGDLFDVEPSATFRHTQYSLGVPNNPYGVAGPPDPNESYDSFPSRAYVQMNLSSRTYINGFFTAGENLKYKHTMIPEINYQVIPTELQSNHRFFGTQGNIPAFREKQPVDNNDLDVDYGGRGVQFDANDRTVRRHLVDFAFTNKIFRKQVSAGDATYTRSLFFRLSQAYDLKEAEQTVQSRPWQDVVGAFDLRLDRFNLFGGFEYFPYHSRTNIATTAQYHYSGQNFISLGYAIRYEIAEDPSATTRDNRTDAIILGKGFYSTFVDFYGGIQYSPKQSEFIDPASGLPRFDIGRGFTVWNAGLVVKPPGKCWLVRIAASQNLNTPYINFSISPEFEFGS